MADGLTGGKVLRLLAASALLLVYLERPAWAELRVHFIDVGQATPSSSRHPLQPCSWMPDGMMAKRCPIFRIRRFPGLT
jgi:hypothetical protein